MLLQHFLDRAANGSALATNLLQLTPCDLWPFIRGRTLWLLGDSLTQVRLWAHCAMLQTQISIPTTTGRSEGDF
jgi:hypothetical protein